MDGEPDRLQFRIRPLHPVADMPRDENMIAGFQIDPSAVFETKRGASRDEQDPLLGLLIVPETLGRVLPRETIRSIRKVSARRISSTASPGGSGENPSNRL